MPLLPPTPAAQAAYQAFIISMITLTAVLLIGAAMGLVAWKFAELVVHTNSMKDALIEATHKLAIIEGRGLAKAEEDARAAAVKEKK